MTSFMSLDRPQIVHRHLQNGMEVYLQKADFAPVVCAQVWVKVGSIEEDPHEYGMAHVLEHMLFKGTKNFPGLGQIASTVEAAGGDMNAYTTFDHTVYYFTAPAAFTDCGTRLLMDVVQNSLLDQVELSKELEVVLEEVRRGRDNPNSVLWHNMFEKAYMGTPFARPIIGYEEVIRNFTSESLRAFYKRWYLPNNMIFIAAGDFNPDELFKKLQILSDQFKPGTLPERKRIKLLPWKEPHSSKVSLPPMPLLSWVAGPYQEMRLQIAVRSPSLDDRDAPAWDMFAALLGGGDSSRLVQALEHRLQLVTSVGTDNFTPQRVSGMFCIAFYAQSQNTAPILEAIVEELWDLARSGPRAEELQRVINSTRASRIYAQESVDGIARRVGNNLLTHLKLQYEDLYLKQLSKVTMVEIQNIAKKVIKAMDDDDYCIAGLHSQEVAIDATQTIQSFRQALRKNSDVASSQTVSSPSSPISEVLFQEVRSTINPAVVTRRYELPYGKELIINYRLSKRLPLVSIAFNCLQGTHNETLTSQGICAFMAQMLTRGTQKQNYRSFVEELEDRAASISAFVSKDIFGMRAESLKEHAHRVLQMTLDSLFMPALQESEFSNLKRETLETLTLKKDSPGYRLSRLIAPELYGEHSYALNTSGKSESVQNFTMGMVRSQWEQIFTAQKFVFGIAGDFELESVSSFIHKEFLNFLSTDSIKAFKMPHFQPLPMPVFSHSKGCVFEDFEREQAHINLAFRGVSINDERRTTLEVAAQILAGQGGRLFLDLRDSRSLAYSVGASQSLQLFGGAFFCYIGTTAHKAEEALRGLKAHLEKLALHEPEKSEVERAQNSLIGSQNIDAQHHSYQAQQMALCEVLGLGFDGFLSFPERVLKVTPQQISKVFKELLEGGYPRIAIVGPQGTWHPTSDDSLLQWLL